jgi:hypothetical protein
MKIPLKIKWLQKSIQLRKEGVQLASGISLLLFYAFALQCQYDRDNEKGNQLLEMAARATYLDECVCIHSSAHCVSDSKVISPQFCTNQQTLKFIFFLFLICLNKF